MTEMQQRWTKVMAESHLGIAFKSFLLLFFFFLSESKWSDGAGVFTIFNSCHTTIWPGITPGGNFDGGGFALEPGESAVFTAPAGWAGRIWDRTGCSFDHNGDGSCQTGGCASTLKCSASGQTPATLAEFTLASPRDFYDVSLVDWFNLPVTVKPVGQGNCSTAGCSGDLLQDCPSELAEVVEGQTVACRSACDVFNTDQYCCRGAYAGPGTCHPTYYSGTFKKACPAAYSYAYDDPTSLFTCSDADYSITFCITSPPLSTTNTIALAAMGRQRACRYYIDRLICSSADAAFSLHEKCCLILLVSTILVSSFNL